MRGGIGCNCGIWNAVTASVCLITASNETREMHPASLVGAKHHFTALTLSKPRAAANNVILLDMFNVFSLRWLKPILNLEWCALVPQWYHGDIGMGITQLDGLMTSL